MKIFILNGVCASKGNYTKMLCFRFEFFAIMWFIYSSLVLEIYVDKNIGGKRLYELLYKRHYNL